MVDILNIGSCVIDRYNADTAVGDLGREAGVLGEDGWVNRGAHERDRGADAWDRGNYLDGAWRMAGGSIQEYYGGVAEVGADGITFAGDTMMQLHQVVQQQQI